MDHRLYTFGNFYLSSIQQGIQAAHALGEMAIKYPVTCYEQGTTIFHEWLNNHKTMICKNGGAEEQLQEIKQWLGSATDVYLPWGFFHEEEPALNNALTCVAIVVSERIWKTGVGLLDSEYTIDKHTGNYVFGNLYAPEAELEEFTEFEFKLMLLIKNSPNAR
jgi:hypothetical protein